MDRYESSRLDTRIEALERVITSTKPEIAILAVDHLIALPDEEAKLAAMVGLWDTPTPEVRDKIQRYLEDYVRFISDAQEKHPSIFETIPAGVRFALSYLVNRDAGDPATIQTLLERAPNYQSPIYGRALLDHGLRAKDPSLIAQGFELIGPRRAMRLIEAAPTDPCEGIELPIAHAFLQTTHAPAIQKGLAYLAKALDQGKTAEVFEALEHAEARARMAPAGKELLNRTALEMYKSSKDPPESIKRVLAVDPLTGAMLAERYSKSKKSFAEIVPVAELLLAYQKQLPEDRIKAIFDNALRKELTFPNLISVGRTLMDAGMESASECFERASKLKGDDAGCLAAASYLLEQEEFDLAETFFDKSAMTNHAAVGQAFLGQGALEQARKHLLKAGEKASTIQDYLMIVAPYFLASADEASEIIIAGLQRFPSSEDHRAALRFCKKELDCNTLANLMFEMEDALTIDAKTRRVMTTYRREMDAEEEILLHAAAQPTIEYIPDGKDAATNDEGAADDDGTSIDRLVDSLWAGGQTKTPKRPAPKERTETERKETTEEDDAPGDLLKDILADLKKR